MVLKAFLKFGLILLVFFVFSIASTARAQDDPNTQFIVLQSGVLSGETREIETPVEVGILRLQFSLQYGGDLTWTVVNPLGNSLSPSDPHLTVTEIGDRRTVALWDPKPGIWKIRLTGAGSFTISATAQGELHICCMQVFGRSGVYPLDRFQPSRGTQQQAQAYASGYNIETVQFQMINEQGEMIRPIKFRQTDYSSSSGFTLLIETPEQPFRVLARGRDTSGKVFQRIFQWLIRPQPAETPNVQSENSAIVTFNNQSLQELSRTAQAGEQRIIRAQVVNWSDEELRSEKGQPIGIRLKYSIRVPVEGDYAPIPQLYPERIGYGYTGALSMRTHKGSVEPAPAGAADPNQVIFGARARFKPDIVYNFTIDLVPNYSMYNDQKKTFCLQRKPYSQQGLKERFEREVMSDQKVRFRFAVSGSDLDGRQPALTQSLYVPNAWYQGFLKEGATDCP